MEHIMTFILVSKIIAWLYKEDKRDKIERKNRERQQVKWQLWKLYNGRDHNYE